MSFAQVQTRPAQNSVSLPSTSGTEAATTGGASRSAAAAATAASALAAASDSFSTAVRSGDSWAAAPRSAALPATGSAARRPAVFGKAALTRRNAVSAMALETAASAASAGPPVFDKSGKLRPNALQSFGQNDGNLSTANYRCSCNSAVASLALQGKDALVTGLANFKQALEFQIRGLAPGVQKFMEYHGQVQELESRAKAGTLTTRDMNQFADLLAKFYDSSPPSEGKSKLSREDILRMQQGLGLVSKDTTLKSVETQGPHLGIKEVFSGGQSYSFDYNKLDPKKLDEFVSQQIAGKLKEGQSASVSVHMGPGGKDLSNHMILVGKKNGQLYVYDPAAETNKPPQPHYMTGPAAERYLKSKLALYEGLTQTKDGTRTSEMYIGADLYFHSPKVAARADASA